MKATKALLGTLGVTLGLAIQVQAQSFLTNGLVLYYPFNGNANDASGNGNNGTVERARLTTDRFGNPNSAYYFNGVSSDILVPETIFGANTAAWTVSVWITFGSGPYSSQQAVYHKSCVNGEMAITVVSNQISFGIKNVSQNSVAITAPILTNSTMQVVGVYQQGQSISLYIDGLVATNTPVDSENLFVEAFLLVSALGSYHYSPGPYDWFTGTLDDFRVYTRALSGDEVQELYAYESGATASAGGNQGICPGNNTAPLGGVVGGSATGGTWTTSGTGTFLPDATTLNASYAPSAGDITAGTVTLTLTTTGPPALNSPATAQVVVTLFSSQQAIGAQPTNLTVCVGSPATFSVGATGGGVTYQWQVSTNNGVTFANTSGADTNATYSIPSTLATESGYQYQVIVSGCGSPVASSAAVLTVNVPATAGAGGNQTVCAGQITGPLGGVIAGGATGGVWASSGTGTFSNPTDVTNATYTPSPADITAGTVTLTLSATGQHPPCAPAVAQVVLTVNRLPAISAQPTNLTDCAGSPAVFSVGATGEGLSYQWQVSGNGGVAFTNTSASDTNTSYTIPSTMVTESGNQYRVIVSGCGLPVTSSPAVLTVTAPATASTSGNQTICAGQITAPLGGVIGGGATGGLWSTSGTGTFSNPNDVTNATYNPSPSDITVGSVTLTLSTTGQLGPCAPAIAQVVLTINGFPAISAQPTNLTAFAGSPATFSVKTTGWGVSYQWQVSINNGMTFTNTSATDTNASYTNLVTALAESGYQYQVIVSGCGSSVTSSPAVLTVNAPSLGFLTNGLVAYYPFNGNANDESGNGYNGVLNGTTISPMTNQIGVTDGAFHFGGGSYVSVTPTPFNVSSNWTISLWCIIDDGNSGANNFVSTGQDTEGGVNLRWVGSQSDPWQCGMASTASPNTAGLWCENSATNNPNDWNMLTCVRLDEYSVELFLNDELLCSSTNSLVGPTLDTGALWFGMHQVAGLPYALVGGLSDVRIYGRAFSASEVQQLYAYELGATAIAGSNQGICPGIKTAPLGGVVGGSATGGTWTTSGTGTFLPDAITLNAVYAPSAADITAGTVTLTLTTTGPPAVNSPATAQVVVTLFSSQQAISAQPTNLTVCAGAPAVFSAGATGGGVTYQWQVSGNGGLTFTNTSATDTNASYTNLVTTAGQSGYQYQVIVSGCGSPVTSSPAVLTFYQPATASAGTNQTICPRSSTAALGGVIGGGATGGVWSSSGTGTFSNPNDVTNATYTPSAADIPAGGVTLTLTTLPCGDATAQVVVTFYLTAPAPTTSGSVGCPGSPAPLSAIGTGGTLNWYSDPGLTTLVNTGTSYAPTLSSTTTYYVTETSGLGCASAASPVTATVFTGPSTANAGPNQVLPTLASTVQLAGSVGNGALGGTWSGGSGTYFPNASTLNAVYTPSSSEVAAGSWALTLTAAPSICSGAGGTSTMSFSYLAQSDLTVNTNNSTLAISICLDPFSGPIIYGIQCQSGTNQIMGDMTLQFDDPVNPTQIALQDCHFTAMSPFVLDFKWISPATIPVSFTIGQVEPAGPPVMVSNSYPQTAQSFPINPDGSFVVSNVPFSSSGMAYYSGTASGSFDLGGQDTIPSISGTVHVTNEVATVHLGFNLLVEGPPSFTAPGSMPATITGYTTLTYTVNATGPTAAPRYLVWNNGAGTGNWNTNDANWNNGSAVWNDGRALDGALFDGAGLGTAYLTTPITASFLEFGSPGYTLGQGAGGSLALVYQSAITNNAPAVIAGALVGTNGLNVWGPAVLTLSGANTYSGPTTIQFPGILEYGSAAAASPNSFITVGNEQEIYFDSGCSGGTILAPISLSGTGIDGGALHTFVPGSTISFGAPITLAGDSQIYGQSVASSTLNFNSGISGNYAVTFYAGDAVPGTGDQDTFVLSAANTYGGSTYITNYGASAVVQLSGGNNRLPTGTTVYLSAGAYNSANSSLLDLNGNNQTLAGLADGLATPGAIRSVLSSSGPATLTLSNALFSGTLDGYLGLTKVGSGTATLSGANTYSGNTVISAGTLALSGGGTLGSASTSLTLAAGTTLDVSALSGGSWSLGTNVALAANGTASPSTIKGPLGGTVNLGAQSIFMPAYDGTHPPFYVAQSTLALNGNPFTINTILPLGVNSYPLIQVAISNTVSAGSFPAVSGTAIGHGYGGSISIGADGQVYLNVMSTLPVATITLGPVAPPQTYGSVSLSATVNPPVATGTVTFRDGTNVLGSQTLDGVTGVVALTPVANQLTVAASPHAIQAVYSGDANYAGSLSSVSNLTVTPLAVRVSGAKTYDGTALMSGASLTVVNNFDGANLGLGGTAALAGKNVPSQAVVATTYTAPVRVQVSSGNTGTAAATTIPVTLTAAPANGNTLVAVIGTRSTSGSSITSISQTGATWKRAVSTTGTAGTTTEIWYAPNVQSAATAVTINQSSVRSAAIIMEYSGVFTVPALDQTANTTGNSTAAVTGTTPTTTQANELCVGGIGLVNSSYTLGTPLNGFASVASAQTSSGSASVNAKIYALDLTNVVATGVQSSGGTVSTSSQWSGAIATFIATPMLTLSGTAATNYTVAGVSGTVTISPLGATVAAQSNTKTYDGTTSCTNTPVIIPALPGGDTSSTLSETYLAKDVGAGNLVIVPASITISDGNSGANYTIAYNNYTRGTIGGKALTVTGSTASDRPYNGTTVEPLGGAPAFQAAEATGAGTTSDGKPYTVDSVSPSGTAAGAFATPYVGVSKPVTLSGVGVTGTGAQDYTVTPQAGLTASITPAVVQLAGSKTYDGTTAIGAGNLSIANNADGANLSLSGSATLAGRNVGTQGILANSSYATPTRVQAASGNTGSSSASSLTVTLGVAPQNGNTLVAVISTRGTTASRISGITQSAGTVTWSHVVDVANAGGVTTEIWYAPNVFFAGTGVTISQASSLRSAALVMEYGGVLSAGAVDQVASATGNTGAATGATPTTTQNNEVWVGGIGLTNSNFTLTLTNGFTSVASAQSTNTSATVNAGIYALEQIVSATGSASTGGTVNTNGNWAGAIATFKAQALDGLTLGGSQATNYTLIGASASVTVAPTNLTVTAAPNTKPYDGTTSAAATPAITAGSLQPGDTAPAWTETYDSKNAGTGKTLTPASLPVTDSNGGFNYNVSYLPRAVGEIDPLGTTTLLAVDINPSGLTTNVTLTATVAGVLPTADLPTSNVVFLANGTPFATNGPLVAGSGSITASTASLPVGTNTLTAQYVGDGNYLGSLSGALSEVVTNSVIYSQTNGIGSVVNNHNGTYTLNLVGTPGAAYYVVGSSSLTAPMAAWTPVAGSTNTASSVDGTWSCVVSNPAPAYYRPVAVNPAP